MTSKENRARVGRVAAIEIASFTFKDVPSAFWGAAVLGIVAGALALLAAFAGAGLQAGGRQLGEIAQADRLLLPLIQVGAGPVRDAIDKSAVALGEVRRSLLVGALPAGADVAHAQEAFAAYTGGAPGARPTADEVVGAIDRASRSLESWGAYLMVGVVAGQVVAVLSFAFAIQAVVRSFGQRYQVALLDFRRDEQHRREFAQSLRIAFQGRRAEAAGAGAFAELAAHFNEGLERVLAEHGEVAAEAERQKVQLARLRVAADASLGALHSAVDHAARAKVSVGRSLATGSAVHHGLLSAEAGASEAAVAGAQASVVAIRLNDLVANASRGIKRLSEDVELLKKQIDLASSVAERVNFLSMNASIVADRAGDAAGLREIAAEASAVYERLKGHITSADSVAASYVSELRSVASDIGLALGVSTEGLSEIAGTKSELAATVSTLASLREMVTDASAGLQSANELLQAASTMNTTGDAP